MKTARLLPVLALLCAVPVSGQDTQPANSSGSDARTAMRSGDYEGAEDTFRQLLREDATLWQARADFVELLTWTGRYELAEELARAAPDALPMANSLGAVLVLRGDLDGAEAAFRHAVDDGAPDALTAEVNLAELLFGRGQINDAMQRFDRFIDIYNNADGRLRATDLVAVGRAVHYLGRNESAMFGDALRAFDEATSLDASWSEPSVRAGDLFLEKYSSPEAKTEYEKALARNPRHPGALLGMAKALSFDNSPGAGSVLTQILEINPNHVEARSIIAAQHLTREGIAEAKEEAETALAVNPQSLIALTTLAASQLVAGELAAFQATRSRALDINPRYAALDTELAEISVQTRRYAQAVERAQAAVALDDAAWEAWGLLGMNQLRVGDIEEGHANIEKAFAGDPFNPWFKNTLDLLDTFERFEVHPTEHFELFLHGTEADLL
ncbi:MAG: tetratricopeptide repeat protein, partial [Gemmatimonadales bacterium]|nr:tetratricopeptide repeat protein [Gemmatimonadales bacterium]